MEPTPSLPRQIVNYLWRATLLRCPVCGTRPMFLPLAKVRSVDDWFAPLDGCPRCGYAYDREPGYFLIAQWGIVYGIAALVGIGIYVWLQVFHSDWSYLKTLLVTMGPLPVVAFLIARHAKAYFLAVDHLCDPYLGGSDDEGGGGGGGSRTLPVAPAPSARPGVARREEAAGRRG